MRVFGEAPSPAATAAPFPPGNSETAGLIRGYDWAATPLGPIGAWPQSLKTAVSLIVYSPIPIVMLWGEDGVMIYNDAYSVFAGGRHPALLGSKVREGWPEVADFNDNVMKVGLAGGTLAYADQELTLNRHGVPEQVWMNLDYSPVFDESNRPAGVIAIVVETTERVLADRRNAAEHDRLRTMFEQAPGFMAVLDGPDHIITLGNQAYFHLIGRDARAIGRPVREVLPEVVGQGPFELLAECYRTGEPYVGQGQKVRLRRDADGSLEDRYVDFVNQPLKDEDGNVTGIFIQGSDVTHRIETDQALRESEQRFRDVANAAPVMIWMSDATKSFTWFNQPWLGYTGRTLDQETGHGWAENLHPDDFERCVTTYDAAFDRREPFRMDCRLRRHDGAWRIHDDTGVPRFAPDGTFLGYLGSLVDVTEAREAEAVLRRMNEILEARVEERTGELAAANRQLVSQIVERERVEDTLRQLQRLEAVGQLTSGVAHDFNNLLTVVLGNLDFLERALAKMAADTKLIDRLNYMRAAAERGANLTAQLLAFSRRQRLEAKPIDLNETVAGMRDLLQNTMGGSVRVETILKLDLWPALVDPTQIELVVLNLAINARDAMEVGGTLTIETANVVAGSPQRAEEPVPGDYVMICVTDTGTGMTEEVVAKAFEPFFTTKEVGRGSGLGLAQVYGFAKQSGGGVAIVTEPGRGTTIKVFLPRAVSHHDVVHDAVDFPTVDLETADLRCRVLLVDDDDDVRAVTASILVDLGCTVVQAGSGGAALDLLKPGGEPFDLMVADFAMPGMNGAEVAREAQARQPGLPVLFVTGYADLTALGPIGENVIVQKPYRGDELVRKVRRLLNQAAPQAAQPVRR